MLGWVVMAVVECGDESFMFAPDVQGPMSNHTAELILASKPNVIMLGGPPLYLGGFRVEWAQLERGLANLERIVEAVPLVVLEHHALRDEQWRPENGEGFPKILRGWAQHRNGGRVRWQRKHFPRIQTQTTLP